MTPIAQRPMRHLARRYQFARALHFLLLLFLAVMGWSRFALALRDQRMLVEIGVTPGPQYLIVSGLAWGLVGIAAAVMFFLPGRGAKWACFIAALFFALSYWIDRLFLTSSPAVQANWPFALVLTLVLLYFNAALLYALARWEEEHGH